MDEFIHLLQIEEIGLKIIAQTWSLQTLRSLQELVREHCHVRTCDPARLIFAIRARYANSNSLALEIMRSHPYGIGNRCHVCGEPGGSNRDHISKHFNGDNRDLFQGKENCRS